MTASTQQRHRRPGWLTAFLTASLLSLLLVLAVEPTAAATGAGGPTTGRWTWPLPGHPPVLRPFEPPAGPYAPGHRGVDLGAAIGTPVLAAGDGVIGYAGRLAGRGVVTVVHGALRTTYEPVTAVVQPGEAVSMGEQIGWLAAPTGHCGAGVPCLHWGLLRGDVYLNPLSLLGPVPVRLLPWSPIPAGPFAVAAGGDAGGRGAGSGRAPGSADRPGAIGPTAAGSAPAGTGDWLLHLVPVGRIVPPAPAAPQALAPEAAERGSRIGVERASGGGGEGVAGRYVGAAGDSHVVVPAADRGPPSRGDGARHWRLWVVMVGTVLLWPMGGGTPVREGLRRRRRRRGRRRVPPDRA